MINLNNLLKYANNKGSLAKEISVLLKKYPSQKISKFANKYLDEKITLDLHQMESLVNSKKFKFEDQDIGHIGVNLHEEGTE